MTDQQPKDLPMIVNNKDGKELLRITPSGEVFVEGKKVADCKELADVLLNYGNQLLEMQTAMQGFLEKFNKEK